MRCTGGNFSQQQHCLLQPASKGSFCMNEGPTMAAIACMYHQIMVLQKEVTVASRGLVRGSSALLWRQHTGTMLHQRTACVSDKRTHWCHLHIPGLGKGNWHGVVTWRGRGLQVICRGGSRLDETHRQLMYNYIQACESDWYGQSAICHVQKNPTSCTWSPPCFGDRPFSNWWK